MDIQLGNALDQNSKQVYHLVLVESGLRILQMNRETGLADETKCFNIGFAQVGQMDYDHEVLHIDTKQGNFRFTFADVPQEEVERFVEVVREALETDRAVEWTEE